MKKKDPRRFEDNNYISVPGFAITKLGLSGNEALLYGLIYGFSQDGRSKCDSSLGYISSALNVTIANAKKILERLKAKGLIKYAGVSEWDGSYQYVIVREAISKGTIETTILNNGNTIETIVPNEKGTIETIVATPSDNYNNIYISGSNNNDKGLFDSEESPTPPRRSSKNNEDKQMLFSSLEIAKDVKAGLTGEWYELFQKYTDEGIDIMAYFDAVYNWSDIKSVKRTRRGWIATIHEWIKRDRESGRLKMMAGAKTASERAFEEAAAEYLKEGGFYK
ncbi:hypothetical protein [Selenomonas ruminantium]|uniref:hypothetical protein n=1 Tax=Selenomonas ruminantium TaxID=971 RepID=UPI0026EA1BB8|nr:hypothetical protein [Selenomonas ruminantium]